ncbi:MAG: hypothetical protein LBB66_08630, partial [Desulfovibrio sp.]|nr:hypothetical protein [Desulfovibrio sp.]
MNLNAETGDTRPFRFFAVAENKYGTLRASPKSGLTRPPASVVERKLPKLEVAGSNPVSRSGNYKAFPEIIPESLFLCPTS